MAKTTAPLLKIFEEYLLQQGLRLTGQRRKVAQAFFAAKGHPSAEELYREVQKSLSGIGFATVYRTLKLLAGAGLAAGHNFGDGFARFESIATTEHHDHLVCSRCGTIVEFTNPAIEILQQEVAERHGFVVKDHILEIYGICKSCA